MSKAFGIGIGVVLAAIAVAGVSWVVVKGNSYDELTGTVQAATWEYTVNREQMVAVRNEGWAVDAPKDAYGAKQEERRKSWEIGDVTETKEFDFKWDPEVDEEPPVDPDLSDMLPSEYYPSVGAVPDSLKKSGQFRIYQVIELRFFDSDDDNIEDGYTYEVDLHVPQEVMATYYTEYYTNRWQATSPLRASDDDPTTAKWPSVEPVEGLGKNDVGQVRESGRSANYKVVVLCSDGKTTTLTPNSKADGLAWLKGFPEGRELVLERNQLTKNVRLKVDG